MATQIREVEVEMNIIQIFKMILSYSFYLNTFNSLLILFENPNHDIYLERFFNENEKFR